MIKHSHEGVSTYYINTSVIIVFRRIDNGVRIYNSSNYIMLLCDAKRQNVNRYRILALAAAQKGMWGLHSQNVYLI